MTDVGYFRPHAETKNNDSIYFTNWGKFVLQIGAAQLLQIEAGVITKLAKLLRNQYFLSTRYTVFIFIMLSGIRSKPWIYP